jgi:hypothetical protein
MSLTQGGLLILCISGIMAIVILFVYSLCFISQNSDEILGLNEWQQEANDEQRM